MTRVRMPLDGGHMDVSISPDASPETVAALQAIGQAAVNRMMKEERMRKWLVLASHDDQGSRLDELDMGNADGLERVTALTSGDGERPAEGDITEALADYGDGEYLFVPLDGDAFTGGVKVVKHVDVQWTGNYV